MSSFLNFGFLRGNYSILNNHSHLSFRFFLVPDQIEHVIFYGAVERHLIFE